MYFSSLFVRLFVYLCIHKLLLNLVTSSVVYPLVGILRQLHDACLALFTSSKVFCFKKESIVVFTLPLYLLF